MKKHIFLVMLAAGLTLGTLASFVFFNMSPGFDSSHNNVSGKEHAVLEIFSGEVMVKSGDSEYVKAQHDSHIMPGDTIKTLADGRAQIVYPNGTVTRLDINSEVAFTTISLKPFEVLVEVIDGKIWSRISELDTDESYLTSSREVKTIVTGTSYGHYILPDGKDKIITTKGQVIGECKNKSKKKVVQSNNKIILDCNGDNPPDTIPISSSDQKDEWFSFNQTEDESLNTRFGPFVYKDDEQTNLSNNQQDNKKIEKTQDTDENIVGNVLGAISDFFGGNEDSNTQTPSLASSSSSSDSLITASITPTSTSQNNTDSNSDNSNDDSESEDSRSTNTNTNTNTSVPKISPDSSNNTSDNGSNDSNSDNLQIPTSTPTTKPTQTPSPTDTPPQKVAELEVLTHSTDVKVDGRSATRGMDIYAGSEVETGTSEAQIAFGNGSVTRLDKNTRVTIKSDQTSTFDISVSLDFGRIWSRIKKLGGQESYETGTDTMVATVRGTSYGHSIDSLYDSNGLPVLDSNNQPVKVNKIITVEGEVVGTCITNDRRPNSLDTPPAELPIKRNQKGIFKCFKEDPEAYLADINNIEHEDAEWTLENMWLDEQLEQDNPEIIYYDEIGAPDRLSDNEVPEVTIFGDNSVEMPNRHRLRVRIKDDGLPIGMDPDVVWTVKSGPLCFGYLPCYEFLNQSQTKKVAQIQFYKEGTYVVHATAYDRLGFGTDSFIVEVVSDNAAPTVFAGEDLEFTQRKQNPRIKTTLRGRVEDDKLPVFGNLSSKWELIEGDESQVEIEEPLSPRTKVIMNAAGTYRFRITADDTEKTSSDEVVVTIREPENDVPVVNVGPDREIEMNANNKRAKLFVNSRTYDDRYPNRKLELQWSVLEQPEAAGEDSCVEIKKIDNANLNAIFYCPGNYTLNLSAFDGMESASDELKVKVVEYGEHYQNLIPSGSIFIGSQEKRAFITLENIFDYRFLNYVFTYDCDEYCEQGRQGAKSTEPIKITANTFSKEIPFMTCSTNGESCNHHPNPRDYKLEVELMNGSKEVKHTLEITDTLQNKVPEVDAGLNYTLYENEAIPLKGTYTDDEITMGGYSTQWSYEVVEGSGTAFISDPNEIETTASVSEPGMYIFTLSVSDGYAESTAKSEVVVLPLPQNTPPSVFAGQDQVLNLPGVATLNGFAEDDGMPDASQLSTLWSVSSKSKSPAGNVRIDQPTELNTIVAFSEPGIYTLVLTADDTQQKRSDEVTIEVIGNGAPSISLPSSLKGSVSKPLSIKAKVTDDGNPVPQILVISWKQLSGPGTASFTKTGEAATEVSFSAPGEYSLQISASDSDKTTTKQVDVSVTPGEVVEEDSFYNIQAVNTAYSHTDCLVAFIGDSSKGYPVVEVDAELCQEIRDDSSFASPPLITNLDKYDITINVHSDNLSSIEDVVIQIGSKEYKSVKAESAEDMYVVTFEDVIDSMFSQGLTNDVIVVTRNDEGKSKSYTFRDVFSFK